VQVNMAERTGRGRQCLNARVVVTTALVVIAALVVPVVAGESLTPRANAVIALVVFGSMLAVVLVRQQRIEVVPPDALTPSDDADG
jgi:hypothetical protein